MAPRLLATCVVVALGSVFSPDASAQTTSGNPAAIALIEFSCNATYIVATDEFAACRLPEIDYTDPQLQGVKGESFDSRVSVGISGLGLEGVGAGINLDSQPVPSGCSRRGTPPPIAPEYCRQTLDKFMNALLDGSTECSRYGTVDALDGGVSSGQLPAESGPGSFYTHRFARIYCAGAKDRIITQYDRVLKTLIPLAPLPKPTKKDDPK